MLKSRMTAGNKRRNTIIVFAMVLLIWLVSPIAGIAGGKKEAGDGRSEAAAAGQANSDQTASDTVKPGDPALGVFVSILPLAYFVERIGAERVQVETLVKPGQEPHTFEPTPQQMVRLAEAQLFFRIGVEYENSLLPRIESTMKGLAVVDCRTGIKLRHLETRAGDEDNDGEHEEHGEHGGTDPHIWLSLRNAIRIAGTIRETLVHLDPAGKDLYDRGHDDLVDDLKALDQRISETLAPVRGRPFFVFHPAFGYFAADYGLEQIAVETGGTQPSARQLARLIEEAQEAGVRVIFVQPQFSQKSAEIVATEIGGAVVPIDPLAGDYIENLERMAGAVEEGLR
jgi:zinc transport system substrate-binding protein